MEQISKPMSDDERRKWLREISEGMEVPTTTNSTTPKKGKPFSMADFGTVIGELRPALGLPPYEDADEEVPTP